MVTLVWSEDWAPVWETQPKEAWKEDPLFLEQQKEDPDEELIAELLKKPKYQLSEEIQRARADRWEEPNDLQILDEDWGVQDEEEHEENLRKLLEETRPVWD